MKQMQPTVATQRTRGWYDARHELSVTGSSAATVLGRGMGSLPDLFREKVERRTKHKTNHCIERGIALEVYVRRAYEKLFGVRVNETGLFVGSNGFVGVSPDGVRAHDHVLLEFKVAVVRHLQDEIPGHYYDQCQCSLFVVESAPYLEYFEVAVEPIEPTDESGWRYFRHDGQQWMIRDYRHHRIHRDPAWVAAALPLMERFHRHVTLARRRMNRKRTRAGEDSIDRFITSDADLQTLYRNPRETTEDLARCVAHQEASLLCDMDYGMSGWIRLRRIEIFRRVIQRLEDRGIGRESPAFYRLGTFSTANALMSRTKPSRAACIVGGSWIDHHGIPANPWIVVRSSVARRVFGTDMRVRGHVLVHCVGGAVRVNKDGTPGNGRWWRYMRALLSIQASVLRANGMTIVNRALIVGVGIRRAKQVISNDREYGVVSLDLDQVACEPLLRRLRGIKSGAVDPRTMKGWKPASLDQPMIRERAIAMQHVSLLPKIREDEIARLYRRGWFTLQDLVNRPLRAMFPKRKIAGFWNRFVSFHATQTAEMTVQDPGLLARAFAVPRGTAGVYVDIESFPADLENDSKPWVFAIGQGHGERRFRFRPTIMRSRSRADERDMVRRFFDSLPDRPRVKCFHWGHVDRTSIARLCAGDPELTRRHRKVQWVDMCDQLRKSGFMLRGVYCYKLKRITRALFGDLYSAVNVDGGEDAMLKAWSLYRSEPDIHHPVLANIIAYNRLDCEILQKIRARLVERLDLVRHGA